MKGLYDGFDVFKINYPSVPGWEGAGRVISSGGGMLSNRLVGKRVAFVRYVDGNEFKLGGCYQQFAVTQG